MNGVAAYGHWGRPVLAFPAERGDAGEFERHGMIAAVGDLVAAGRVKLYCVDSFDHETWSNRGIPLEERARRHGVYESWILDEVVPFIRDDCGGAHEMIACGCSLGAFHAANFALKRADVFPLAIVHVGQLRPVRLGRLGRARRRRLLQQPDGLRRPSRTETTSTGCAAQLSVLLVCGQGQWEDTTGALESTRRFAALLQIQGDPLRAGPVGVRRRARLAVVARPARASSATLLSD